MPGPLNAIALAHGKVAYVAPNAAVTEDVELHEDTNIWYSASIRGDEAPISVGRGTNVQDNAVLHCDPDVPLLIGPYVTIGHGAVIHCAKVGEMSLIGMGAVLLSGASIGPRSLVAAGALVTPGKKFEEGSLILGSPAKAVRKLTDDELNSLDQSWRHYVALAKNSTSVKFIGGEDVS